MAKFIRGKRKGEEAEIHQFANDWVMIEPCTITSPTSLVYTVEEMDRFLANASIGIFWSLFEVKTVLDGKYWYGLKKRKYV